MAGIITDAEIGRLITELKFAAPHARDRLVRKPSMGHLQADLSLTGMSGRRFVVKLRQNKIRRNDFSVVLVYLREDTGGHFRLMRCNGSAHPHRNYLERPEPGWEFRDEYHIHVATQRYQEAHYDSDHYAEVTDRFANFREAFRCMTEDSNIRMPEEQQTEIFEWWQHV